MRDLEKFSGYLGCFLIGVILTFAVTPVWNLIKEEIYGFEIQSLASFPATHIAKVRSRPRIGKQKVFVEVDGEDVFTAGGSSGDLNEELTWDSTGKILTFKLNGEILFVFDVESKIRVNCEKE